MIQNPILITKMANQEFPNIFNYLKSISFTIFRVLTEKFKGWFNQNSPTEYLFIVPIY